MWKKRKSGPLVLAKEEKRKAKRVAGAAVFRSQGKRGENASLFFFFSERGERNKQHNGIKRKREGRGGEPKKKSDGVGHK